ncbi:MAG: hypothetical protein UT43_C0027G0004 [Parcubacteria group bacterium GW2011_GWC1_39_29]|uniref:Uncharacterized protein n=1 Tax=Candidatus Yanofskybacteria bacterium GW2011_GWD1_39_16 TaxID=1619030 RepID=A0A837HQ89_9BACT|nr:MAG: hypothetical protein UT35_C0025G0004 [Candidatus Yanofskybacteria bacterium GW2011_GWD1_39_16]KKR14434.1 MAG: hypothetical protein UT43_C0027G0004 [Parcubacteria group bacterium GW2011_GWC1_39_29]
MFIIIKLLAAGQGLEPRYHGPKPRVLPLDDPAKYKDIMHHFSEILKSWVL